jgi:hypothetical protein
MEFKKAALKMARHLPIERQQETEEVFNLCEWVLCVARPIGAVRSVRVYALGSPKNYDVYLRHDSADFSRLSATVQLSVLAMERQMVALTLVKRSLHSYWGCKWLTESEGQVTFIWAAFGPEPRHIKNDPHNSGDHVISHQVLFS